MGYWTYRAAKSTISPLSYKDDENYDYYSIREFYYEGEECPSEVDNSPKSKFGWTEAIRPIGDSKEELIETLEEMLRVAREEPIIDIRGHDAGV